MRTFFLRLFAIGFLFLSCNNRNQRTYQEMPTIQHHSYANADEVRVEHLDLDLEVDFELQEIKGMATWQIEPLESANRVVFDCKHIEVLAVVIDEKPVAFTLTAPDSLFGSALIIPITPSTKQVSIRYKTLAGAEALQWLDKEQAGGAPFLYTQSQAILARTWVPCMDLPSVRFTYNATVTCPGELLALMSASNPKEKNDSGVYHFEMPQRIPSYLLALCVGDLSYASLGDNCGVYAIPSVLPLAAAELSDLDRMIKAAEALYGPYQWGRYDVVFMPASFPFGGMENPRLTFATPTILTGDKSLVSLIAHELAHSWSGNLVTNKTWEDFWLNEGFTVYFEDRIMEAVYGRPFADMMMQIGFAELKETLAHLLITNPNDTKLYLDLEGRNPDDGVTDIAYEKGRFFLLHLERIVGRERFDAFLNTYFAAHAFTSVTTASFIEFVNDNLFEIPKEAVDANLNAWIYDAGLPAKFPIVSSQLLDAVNEEVESIVSGKKQLSKVATGTWTTFHFLHFLRSLPQVYTQKNMKNLEDRFGFSTSQNAEIAALWFKLCIENGFEEAKPMIADFLLKVGRRKFVLPLYKAMTSQANWVAFAKEVFQKASPTYHMVTRGSVASILNQ